ncbi:uncharacterized protein LOC116255671 [Nymphaea colorata]|nr:uncharacterized protein LOC116255671 [Nymphaea colorata]
MENSRVSSSSDLSNKNHANPRCHLSPTSPYNATDHTGRTTDSGDSFGDKINESNQETMNHHFTKPMGSNYHASGKIFKPFTGHTVPAASKVASTKKEILGENGEILNSSESNAVDEGAISTTMYSSFIMMAEESLNESAKAAPHQSTASSSSVQGIPDACGLHYVKDCERITSSLPYDPVNNYLTPRPQYLRYRPNRRLEWVLSNKRRPDDEEQSVSDESNMDQIEKDRNFSEGENLCILSSEDESSENHEDCSGFNQENSDANPAKGTRESREDKDDDDDHCEEINGSSSSLLCRAIIFVFVLGGFSLCCMDWPPAPTSHTFPHKIIFQAKYVARSLKETPNSFQCKCLKVIENRNRENQNEILQVLAGYLCAVLYPHSAGHEAQSAQTYPISTVENRSCRENSSHISGLEDEVPLSMYHQNILEHIGNEESDDSSRMAVEREPVEQEPSLLVGTLENAGEENEMQETRRVNNGTGEAEHGLPKYSKPLEVLKDDNETEEIEYELRIFEVPEDLGDGELTGGPDYIVVMEPEVDQIVSEEEEYEINDTEDQLGIDTDKQLNDDESEIRGQRSWLRKNKATNNFVVGIFALTAVISTTFYIFHRRKNSRVGGAGEVGTPFLSCEKETTEMGSAHSPDGRIDGVNQPRAVRESQEAQTGHRLATHSPDGRINGVNKPRAVGGSQVAQTGHRLATSSVCCNEDAGANLAASSKGNHDVTSSLHPSMDAEAKPEVSSGRRYRKKNVTTYTNLEAVTPPSENSTAASFSYGSFYSQGKFKGSGDEGMVTPVRRSSRIRKQVYSPR